MSIKSRDIRMKKVICEDMTVGEVKELIIDPSSWKVIHLEVDPTKALLNWLSALEKEEYGII